MISTILASAPVVFVLAIAAAIGVWVTAQYGLLVGVLTGGGVVTLATVFYVVRLILKLKAALRIAAVTIQTERKLHLLVLQRVKTHAERAKTNKHRLALVDGLQKYIRDFAKVVPGGEAIKKLGHDTAAAGE